MEHPAARNSIASAQHRRPIGRHDPPVDGAGAGEPQLALDDLGGLQAIGGMDEQHAEAAGTGRRQLPAERLADPGPWNRGEDAAAIDRSERRLGPPVGQAPQRRKAVRHDVAAGAAAGVSDEPDPAGVVIGRRLNARLHEEAFIARPVR